MSFGYRLILIFLVLITTYIYYIDQPFSFIILIIIIIVFSVYVPYFFGSTWVPIDSKSMEKMIKIADIKNNDIVYDLGCGDGKIVKRSSKLSRKSIGIEISPLQFLLAKLKTLFIKNVEIKYGNLFNFDIKEADVVFLYLPSRTLGNIENKDLFKKGARLVTRNFKFPKMKPVKNIDDVYLYLVD